MTDPRDEDRNGRLDPVLNAAFYCFGEWTGLDLAGLKNDLLTSCLAAGLKGTILLSPEGINVSLAGAAAVLGPWLAQLQERLRTRPWTLPDFEIKFSPSPSVPFSKMLVKIKKEIIAFGVEGISPARETAPRLKPAELALWLDEGRDVVLLDTRNDYEFHAGTFEGALDPGLKTFRDFPEKLKEMAGGLKGKDVVMFCTGGIRCEKASALALQLGLSSVWQLDGGILKYFEQAGGRHWKGSCYVFDERGAVDTDLQPAAPNP